MPSKHEEEKHVHKIPDSSLLFMGESSQLNELMNRKQNSPQVSDKILSSLNESSGINEKSLLTNNTEILEPTSDNLKRLELKAQRRDI